MGIANGLRAISLATIVAIAGVATVTAPVAATDPSPTPTPEATESPTASPEPSSTATPEPTSEPTPTSTPTSEPTALASPEPVASPVPTATVAAPIVGARIARIALNQRGRRYVRGADGPRAFDCSGLVRYAYRKAGISRRLGGGHSARAMLLWGRRHGLTGRHHPRIGDVVIYGNGSHAAIYIGRGRVVSALNPRLGIRITRLHALSASFTTFIHTRK